MSENKTDYMIDLFSSEDCENETFKNIKCIENDFSDRLFSNCIFLNCDFSGSDFSSSTFEHCVFKECNLGLIKIINTSLLGAEFLRCKILGVSFIKCRSFGLDMKFTECNIHSCNFGGLKLRKSFFKKCEIVETDFIGTDLTESDFSESSFAGAVFNNTNLTKVNFTSARGYQINPLNNTVKKAIFTLPEAVALLEQMDIILR